MINILSSLLMKHIYLSLAVGLLCQAALAQVPTRNIQREERAAHVRANAPNAAPPAYRLRELDVAAFLEADKREAGQGELPRFGRPRPLALDLLAAGKWEPAAGGRMGKFAVTSPGARSLNFLFDKFYLPPGAELYLYSSDRSTVMGPITAAQNTEAGGYATDLLRGETVTFELFEPDAARGQSVLHTTQVVHGYQDLPGQPYAGYGQAEPCNVDINCPAGSNWQTESNAVALILFPSGQYGSGALLNDNCQSLTPNFLSAFHNLKQGATKDWVFRFQYKSPTCGGVEPTNYLSFSGAQLVASYEPSDFALMRLNQKPPAGSGINLRRLEPHERRSHQLGQYSPCGGRRDENISFEQPGATHSKQLLAG